MPGILGISNPRHQNVGCLLKKMTELMQRGAQLIVDEELVQPGFAASRIHLASTKTAELPYRHPTGVYIWFEGEVYNGYELQICQELIDDKNKIVKFEDLVAIAYQNGSLKNLLERVDGYFSLSIYDPKLNKIYLITDRHGLKMLYWFKKDETFSWASEVTPLLSISNVSSEIDFSSINTFIELGYVIGQDTFFKYVKLVDPATILEYDIGSQSVLMIRYWSWSAIKPLNLNFNQSVDAMYDALMESVEKRFSQSERIGISLSGGLDSRAIFAAVDRIAPNYPGVLYTFGSKDCSDIKIAKMVAARSKWQHLIFNSSNDDWLKNRYKMVCNTDGMLSIMHMHGAEMLESIASLVDVNLNGYCGDVVYGGGWVDGGWIGVKPSCENLKKHYFGFDSAVNYNEPYFDLQVREIGLYPHRARRFTNLGVVNTLHAVDHRLPFFGNHVLDVAFGIPENYRKANYAYSTMLKKCFPKYFVDIPWQKTGRPAARLPRGIAKFARLIGDRLANLMGFSESLSLKEGYAQYADWIRNPAITTELNNLFNSKQSNIFPCSGVAWRSGYLDPHLKNFKIDHSEKIMRTATLIVYFGSLSLWEQAEVVNEKILKTK